MLAVRLPNEIEQRLAALAQKTGRSKSYYVRKAVKDFLQDEEDYLLAIARLEEKNPRIPFEKVRSLVEMDN